MFGSSSGTQKKEKRKRKKKEIWIWSIAKQITHKSQSISFISRIHLHHSEERKEREILNIEKACSVCGGGVAVVSGDLSRYSWRFFTVTYAKINGWHHIWLTREIFSGKLKKNLCWIEKKWKINVRHDLKLTTSISRSFSIKLSWALQHQNSLGNLCKAADDYRWEITTLYCSLKTRKRNFFVLASFSHKKKVEQGLVSFHWKPPNETEKSFYRAFIRRSTLSVFGVIK